MKNLIILIILFFLSFERAYPDTLSYGLQFQAHDVPKEKRTSLLLNNGSKMKMPSGFQIDFDVKFNPELHNYGYIFRIIANDSICFDLVSNFTNDRRALSFIEGSDIFVPFDSEILDKHNINDWASVNLVVDNNNKEIIIGFNGEKVTLPYRYGNLTEFVFQFGQCSHPQFEAYDVPPMSIRNVRVTTPDGKTVAFWPLREHSLTAAYDSISGRVAIAKNPTWLIDSHTSWSKLFSLKTGQYTQLAYDNANGSIYLADQTRVYRVKPQDNTVDTISVQSGNPYLIVSNQMIFNDKTGELWSYDINRPINRFDFATGSWSESNPTLLNPEYAQHNAVISPVDSCLYIFGGYGEYRYLNNLIKYSPKTERWDTVSVNDKIPPRYLASAGFISPDSLLIFGGFGHPSGMQELGPGSYYDLFVLNPSTGATKKICDFKGRPEQMVGSNSLVADKKNHAFYTLYHRYNQNDTRATLNKFDFLTGEYTLLADSVTFRFQDINSYISLFLDENAGKLYAVIVTHDGNISTTDIYELNYPPLSTADVILPEKSGHLYLWLCIAAIIIIVSVTAFIMIRRRKKKHMINDAASEPEDMPTPITNTPEKMPQATVPHVSSILFLGGFQIWDKEGNNMTKSFTPTLKRLLVLIVLYSFKDGKGIGNDAICDILWPDKSRDNAQNNRRVSIYKLKTLLEQVGDVEIINSNAYWTIKLGEGTFCDYVTVMDTLREFRNSAEINPAQLHTVLNLIAKGQPLPAITQTWIDSFKSDYAACVQDTLSGIVNNGNITDYKLLTRIADIMFIFDSTDETAISIKCRALVKAGKIGMAKSAFDSFCSEYQTLLGENYEKSFQDILNE